MDFQDKTVFHYTSIDGLLGITESSSIWGTNILYLNDASEFSYANTLLSSEIAAFCEANTDFIKDKSWGYYFFESLENNIKKLLPSEHFSSYVCSFSEESDLLSQWRGYCKNNSGYSLGFKLNRLQSWVKQAGFAIKPCIYEERKQIDAIAALLRKASERFVLEVGREGQNWDAKSKRIAADIVVEYIQLAPFLKHPKFEEEHEWRIVANLKTEYVKDQIKFRTGSTMIIPYIEISLPTASGRLVMDEVFIGPTNDRELVAASVKLLLKSKNVTCNSLKCSTIPYRAV
jgi:hypothetical protein